MEWVEEYDEVFHEDGCDEYEFSDEPRNVFYSHPGTPFSLRFLARRTCLRVRLYCTAVVLMLSVVILVPLRSRLVAPVLVLIMSWEHCRVVKDY